MDATSRIEALIQLAGGKAVHPHHLAALHIQDAVVSQIEGAVGDIARMLPGNHKFTIANDAFAPLGQFAEEEDVSLLERPVYGHILPLGPVAIVIGKAPGGIEQFENQGVIDLILIELRILLAVLQVLAEYPVVERLKIQPETAKGLVDPLLHAASALQGRHLRHKSVG